MSQCRLRVASPYRARDARISCEPPVIKVLCVDDDASSLALVERCLRHMARYEPQITTAGSIMTACFALTSDTFDVAIIDNEVLGASGIELIREFAGGIHAACQYILATGHLTPDVEAAAIAAGATRCISKDELTAKGLEGCIHEALTGHGAKPPLKASLGLQHVVPPQPALQMLAALDVLQLTGSSDRNAVHPNLVSRGQTN